MNATCHFCEQEVKVLMIGVETSIFVEILLEELEETL